MQETKITQETMGGLIEQVNNILALTEKLKDYVGDIMQCDVCGGYYSARGVFLPPADTPPQIRVLCADCFDLVEAAIEADDKEFINTLIREGK